MKVLQPPTSQSHLPLRSPQVTSMCVRSTLSHSLVPHRSIPGPFQSCVVPDVSVFVPGLFVYQAYGHLSKVLGLK